jgi:hypothetical protein
MAAYRECPLDLNIMYPLSNAIYHQFNPTFYWMKLTHHMPSAQELLSQIHKLSNAVPTIPDEFM